MLCILPIPPPRWLQPVCMSCNARRCDAVQCTRCGLQRRQRGGGGPQLGRDGAAARRGRVREASHGDAVAHAHPGRRRRRPSLRVLLRLRRTDGKGSLRFCCCASLAPVAVWARTLGRRATRGVSPSHVACCLPPRRHAATLQVAAHLAGQRDGARRGDPRTRGAEGHEDEGVARRRDARAARHPPQLHGLLGSPPLPLLLARSPPFPP